MAKRPEPVLDPEQTYRSAMRDLIGSRFAALWRAAPVALAGEDPEGVHDVRVASRRLRAAMDVAGDGFATGWYRPLRAVVKEITGALGEVRDRDVLLAYFAAARQDAEPDVVTALDRLTARVEREREEARGRMMAFFANLDARGIEAESKRRFGGKAGRDISHQERIDA